MERKLGDRVQHYRHSGFQGEITAVRGEAGLMEYEVVWDTAPWEVNWYTNEELVPCSH